jgi:hypothetical protein
LQGDVLAGVGGPGYSGALAGAGSIGGVLHLERAIRAVMQRECLSDQAELGELADRPGRPDIPW